MSLIATPFNVIGVGRILEIGDLNKVGTVSSICVKLESERRRMSGANQLVEFDHFYVQIWDSGADVFNDRAKVGDAIAFTGELRNKKGAITLKINKFEIYEDEKSH